MDRESLIEVRDSLNQTAQALSRLIEDLIDEKTPETWVTTRQASEITGLNVRTIQRWAQTGRVKSRRYGSSRNEVVLEEIQSKFL